MNDICSTAAALSPVAVHRGVTQAPRRSFPHRRGDSLSLRRRPSPGRRLAFNSRLSYIVDRPLLAGVRPLQVSDIHLQVSDMHV